MVISSFVNPKLYNLINNFLSLQFSNLIPPIIFLYLNLCLNSLIASFKNNPILYSPI